MAIGLSVGALIMAAIGILSSVMAAGQAELNVAAVCFSSFLIGLVSLAYGVASFLERDKKYVLSKIGIGISGLLTLAWLILIIIGFGG